MLRRVTTSKHRYDKFEIRISSVVNVRCLRCRHQTKIPEAGLRAFGLSADAPVASFIKRLRCKKCGCQSVEASRQDVRVPYTPSTMIR